MGTTAQTVFTKMHGLVENHSNISHARVDISIQVAYAGSHLSRALKLEEVIDL